MIPVDLPAEAVILVTLVVLAFLTYGGTDTFRQLAAQRRDWI